MRRTGDGRARFVLGSLLWLLLAAVAAMAVGEICFCLRRPKVRSIGRNGLWLAHTWVGEEHDEKSYQDLAARLTSLGITDAFFHAGPLTATGTVAPDRLGGVQ